MLTKELLKQTAELTNLSDEQLSAIETLSKNDEDRVIGARIGEIYRQEDDAIQTLTGYQRNGDEKTYLFRERVLKDLTEKVKATDGLNKQVADLLKEKARLEKAIADGDTDNESKKALAQLQKDFAAVTKDYTELKSKYDNAQSQYESELFGIRIDNELKMATSKLNFKKELPEAVTKVVLNQAIEKIKGMSPEYVDDEKGGKVFRFKDADGAVLRNPENKMSAYTANELLVHELKTLGVLDEGRKQPGGGTGQPNPQPNAGGTIDVSGAKTQQEAYEIIAQSLMAQGKTNGSAAFSEAMSEAWKSNNIANLPEK